MIKNKSTYFLLLFVFVLSTTFSQNTNVRFNEISKEDQKGFQKQVKDNIKNLGYRLKVLAKVNDVTVQKNIIEAQLDYFIKDAKFQTGTINKKNKRIIKKEYSVKNYLTNIVTKYKKQNTDIIDIEFASFNVGSKLIPVQGKVNEYYFEFSFTQIFRRGKKSKNKNAEGIVDVDYTYVDITKKKGRVYLKKKNTILGSKWKLYFGDILVEDIKV